MVTLSPGLAYQRNAGQLVSVADVYRKCIAKELNLREVRDSSDMLSRSKMKFTAWKLGFKVVERTLSSSQIDYSKELQK